jgi:hypothetical protein
LSGIENLTELKTYKKGEEYGDEKMFICSTGDSYNFSNKLRGTKGSLRKH